MITEIKQGKQFKKQFKKLPTKLQRKTIQQLILFAKNKKDKNLKNHKLRGNHKDNFSINITGDYRAIYKEATEGIVIFIAIGTHHQLYGK